jgi:hypothetical protein
MLAAYHLERLGSPPPPPWLEHRVERTEEMDLQAENAKGQVDALESVKLDLKMLAELREDGYDLLLTNQALRAHIQQLKRQPTEGIKMKANEMSDGGCLEVGDSKEPSSTREDGMGTGTRS